MEQNISSEKTFLCTICESEFDQNADFTKHIQSVHEVKENFNEKKHNPWEVENVSVFLKYHCPECEFNDCSLGIFTDHALTNHENATILFPSQEYEEPEMKVEVEENCNFCRFVECICKTNEVQNEVQHEGQTFDSDLKLDSIEEYSDEMKNVTLDKKGRSKKEYNTKKPKMIKPWDIENQILCEICPIKELSTLNAAIAHRFVSFTYLSILSCSE